MSGSGTCARSMSRRALWPSTSICIRKTLAKVVRLRVVGRRPRRRKRRRSEFTRECRAIPRWLPGGRWLRRPIDVNHTFTRRRTMDATELLESQHRMVEDLFEEIENADGEEKMRLFEEI